MPIAAPSTRPVRLPAPGRAALALALFAAGCASNVEAPPPIVPAGWASADEDGVRPTLGEIFLAEPPYGEPPQLLSASADGRFALARWYDPALEEDERAANAVRLLAAEAADPVDAGRTRPAGTPLHALLLEAVGAEESATGSIRHAWSGQGHRLALARGHRVWILDADGKLALAARWDPPPEPAPADDAEEAEGASTSADDDEAEAAPPELRLGKVRSVAFRPDDLALQVSDGRELVLFPVGGGLPAAPLGLDDAVWMSRDVASPARRLRWSDDLRVVFGDDPLPNPDSAPDNQVWIIDEQREVALEAWAESEDGFESARLAPDGTYLAALEVDRSEEPAPVELPNYLTERVTHTDGRRKLADDRPSPTRIWVWNVWTGAREEIRFDAPLACESPTPFARGEGDADEPPPTPRDRISLVRWSPPGETEPTLLIERRSEDFRRLELWTWRAGEFIRRHAERDPGWIGGPARTTLFSADGDALLFGSEVAAGSTTPGRSQLFRVDLRTGERRQLTQVEGEVTGFRALDGGGVLVHASNSDPAQRGYYHLDPDAARGIVGVEPERYDLPPGYASGGRAARSGGALFVQHATALQPAEIAAVTLGGEAQVLTTTTPAAFRELDLAAPARLTLVAADGTPVHAHVYAPPGVELDGGPPRAAIVFAHGAGYLQNVTESLTRYPLNALFHARLARMGYLVLDVDFRGSAGYGGAFRTDVQYRLGEKELEDIALFVDELSERGVIDERRVGIYGGSYGGFLALMALFTQPDRWAAGAALRSVTDWRTYHPGYTQPRLGRPSTHPAAYARSSPIDLVDGVRAPLLVLHGMRDSNVFAQDSIRLIEALIDAGADFDAMLYPSQGHGFSDGAHWLDEYRRIERFMIEHLGPPLLFEDGGMWPYGVWIGDWYRPWFFGPGWHDYDPDDGGGGFDGPTLTSPSSSRQGSPQTSSVGGRRG